MGFLGFLLVYIFGGLTFLPLLATLCFAYFHFTLPVIDKQDSLISPADEAASTAKTKKDEANLSKLKYEQDVAAGYFAVTREWTPGGINGKPPERVTPIGIKGDEPNQSMYQTVVGTIFNRKGNGGKGDANGTPKKKRAANVFYVVLRLGHLMLYDDSEQLEVRHVISLSHHNVTIYGGGEDIPEGELYIRRNAICLTRKDSSKRSNHFKPFYLFSENCSEKEDFYFALLKNGDRHSEKNPNSESPTPLGFDPAHLIQLVQNLHSSEEQLQTRWINALLGRLFLAFSRTPDLEQFFRNKIEKKIARVKKPAFLTDIAIQKVDVGEGAPYITNPKLRELNVDGETIVEANVSYSGGFRIEVFTAARIDLGAHFKAREVDLMLAAVLKKLEGRVLIRIKPPPSNRIWVAFESTPKMELIIEPIISQRSITYRPILQLIENRVREVIEETLVFPHFDDLPFTDTVDLLFRGGIWKNPKLTIPESPASEPSPPIHDIEKELVVDDSVNNLLSDNKSISLPNLATSSLDGKKYTSSTSATDISSDTSSGTTQRVHRKPKSLRTPSFAQVTSPRPLVSNIIAVGDTAHTEKDNGVAKSHVKATMDRVSMSDSPKSTPVGSPSNSITPALSTKASATFTSEGVEKQDEFFPALEEPMNWDSKPISRHSRSQSLTSSISSTVPSTPLGLYRRESQSFKNSAISPMSPNNRANSNLSAALNQQNPSPNPGGAKPAINSAINKGVAAVTKWYKGKTESNANNDAPTSPTAIEGFLRGGSQGPTNNSSTQINKSKPFTLPPPDIPLPPTKRTAPINVPKRRTLPPPRLPTRNNGHSTNNGNNKHVVDDDVMIVAAPPVEPDDDNSSEPNTPPDEFMVSLDGNTIHRSRNSGGLAAGLGMMLRGEHRDRERPNISRRPSSNSASASASGSSGDSPGDWDVAKHHHHHYQRQRGTSRSGEGLGIGNISLKGKTSPGKVRGFGGGGGGGGGGIGGVGNGISKGNGIVGDGSGGGGGGMVGDRGEGGLGIIGMGMGIGLGGDEIPWNQLEEAELRDKAGW